MIHMNVNLKKSGTERRALDLVCVSVAYRSWKS